MCGIIAGCGTEDLIHSTLKGLLAVEYRGYDSAGISTLSKNTLCTEKVVGKVKTLIKKAQRLEGSITLAHTRWATHGPVSTLNAHPHTSHDTLSIVHNGIIENYTDLKIFLSKSGYTCISASDSEVIAHLMHFFWLQEGSMDQALKYTVQKLKGSFAFIALFKDTPHTLYAACQNSPLILGQSQHSHWLASDALALTHVADQCWTVPDQHLMVITPNNHTLTPIRSKIAAPLKLIQSIESIETNKQDFKHFMLKEIHQQPQLWKQLINTYFNQTLKPNLLPSKPQHVHMVSCGSSHHASLTAQYWLESLAHLPNQAFVASEYRDRDIHVPENCMLILTSQSGETADTLAALRKAKKMGYATTLSLCNVPHSTLAHLTDHCLPLLCGPEIGVASTKAFTAQLWVFFALATHWSDQKTLALDEALKAADAVLALTEKIKELAEILARHEHVFFIGRHLGYPTAQEAALKLKEISYIHAHAYASGELKHGPLALIDKNLPVCAAIMAGSPIEKHLTHLEEISARNGLLVIFHQGQPLIKQTFPKTLNLELPKCSKETAPMVFAIAYQLLAYYVAMKRGCEIDQPRNLAKSVTVE